MRPLARSLFLAALLTTTRAFSQPPPAPPLNHDPPIPWQSTLQDAGKTYLLYFTIEYDHAAPHATDSLYQRKITAPPAPLKDAPAFLGYLRTQLPNADIFPDALSTDVLHIREKSLAARPEYLLNEKTDFLFHGTLGDLLATIAREHYGDFQEGILFNRYPGRGFRDHYPMPTPTELYLKAETFRTVLTAAIPRRDSRILWDSEALAEEGRLRTLFQPDTWGFDAANTAAPATGSAHTGTQAAEIDAAMRLREQLPITAAALVGRPNFPVTTGSNPNVIAMTNKLITHQIPLRNIPAPLLLADLKPFLSPDARTGIIDSPNSLVIADTETRIKYYVEMVRGLEHAAGLQRAAAVAAGADPRGLAWAEKFPPATPPPAAPVNAPANPWQTTAVYDDSDPTKVDLNSGMVTYVVWLEHANAATLLPQLQPQINPAAILSASPIANCILIKDTAPHIQQLLQAIARHDQ